MALEASLGRNSPAFDQRASSLAHIITRAPDLVLPFQAIQNLQRQNQDAFKGREEQTLAYSLYMVNPDETPKIAKIFGVTEKKVKAWINAIQDSEEEDDWTRFDEEIERLQELDEKTSETDVHYSVSLGERNPSPLWKPVAERLIQIPGSIGPGLLKVVASANRNMSIRDVAKETGHTYGGARQRLVDARKKIQANALVPNGHVPVQGNTELLLAVSMGRIEGLKIGKTIYAKQDDDSTNLVPHTPQTISGENSKQPQVIPADYVKVGNNTELLLAVSMELIEGIRIGRVVYAKQGDKDRYENTHTITPQEVITDDESRPRVLKRRKK